MYAELDAARANWRYQPPVDLLVGRTVLVTGAGDGIGRCAARTFAAYRANVVLLGRSQPKLEAVFDAIIAETDTDPTIVPCDLEAATVEAYADLRDQITDHYGRLDGLLHNASMLGPRVPLEFYDVDSWRHCAGRPRRPSSSLRPASVARVAPIGARMRHRNSPRRGSRRFSPTNSPMKDASG